MTVTRSLWIVTGMLACVGSTPIIAAPVADSSYTISTTSTGRTVDARGVQLVHSDAGGNVDTLMDEALKEYLRLYPDAVDYTVTTLRRELDGRLVITVEPYDAGPQLQAPPGAPPDMPPPPPGYPATPEETTQVGYHQERNGYTRDTTYQRDQNIQNGQIVNGPWWVRRDNTEYTGGGGNCGGSTGQIPCPKPQ
jgi:hypothetical protein